MPNANVKEFLVRTDSTLFRSIKAEADRRGIAVNKMMNRVLLWWMDQPEEVKDDSIKYASTSRTLPERRPAIGVEFDRTGKAMKRSR